MPTDIRYVVPGFDQLPEPSGAYWETIHELYYDYLNAIIVNYPSGVYASGIYDPFYGELYDAFYREANIIPPLQSDGIVMFPSQFYSLVYNMIEEVKAPLELILKNKINVAPAYPEVISETLADAAVNVDNPSKRIGYWIVYREKLAQPGGFGGPMFTGPKEIRFRTREYNLKNIYNKYSSYRILGQAREYLIQFDIFAPTHYETELLTQWFDLLMFTNAGYFVRNGCGRVVWLGHTEDQKLSTRPKMAVRSTQYGLRLEILAIAEEDMIKRIGINLGNEEQT